MAKILKLLEKLESESGSFWHFDLWYDDYELKIRVSKTKGAYSKKQIDN